MADQKIIIAGAGSIGCFVGGLLLAAGRNVSFLGRQKTLEQLKTHGLTITDYAGMRQTVDPGDITISTEPEMLAEADIILVCVKSGATAEIANLVKTHARAKTIIVSLQNGVRNARTLQEILPSFDVRAGMVPFNVVQLGKGQFHRGTSGIIKIEEGMPDLAASLNVANLQVETAIDMEAVLWGKLLVNLNNALNALSGLPLAQQLSQRPWRLKLAAQMREALTVFKAANIKPKPPSPVPAWVLPHILGLPTPLFRAVAKQMLDIDPQARSSMWEDIQLGRKTEIDELQGEILRLAEKHNIPVPTIRQVTEEIRKLEKQT